MEQSAHSASICTRIGTLVTPPRYPRSRDSFAGKRRPEFSCMRSGVFTRRPGRSWCWVRKEECCPNVAPGYRMPCKECAACGKGPGVSGRAMGTDPRALGDRWVVPLARAFCRGFPNRGGRVACLQEACWQSTGRTSLSQGLAPVCACVLRCQAAIDGGDNQSKRASLLPLPIGVNGGRLCLLYSLLSCTLK